MTTSMSDDTLARIKELLAKATQPTWRVDGIGSDGSFAIWWGNWSEADPQAFVICARPPIEHRAEASRTNAQLIVALRNAASSLISRVEAAEARAAAAEAERDALRTALEEIESLGWKEGLGVGHAVASHYAIRKVARAALTANPKDTEGERA